MIKLKTLLTQLKEDGFGATMNAQEMNSFVITANQILDLASGKKSPIVHR